MPDDAPESVQTEAPDDIRSMLEAAFVATDKPETEQSSDDRPRDEAGRFVRKQAESEPDQTAAPEAPEAEKPDEQKPETEKPAVEPHPRWNAELKAKFAELPPEAQQFVLERERESEANVTRKTQEIAQFRKTWEPVQAVFEPHARDMAQAGWTPATLVKAWADVEVRLRSDPISVMADIARSYNVDRAALSRALGLTAPSQQNAADTPPPMQGEAAVVPPEIQRTLEALQSRQSQFDRFLQTQQQQARASEENRVNSAIQQFREATDKAGNLLHPHFEEAEAMMANLAEASWKAGKPPDLEDLYNQAVWAIPSTREKLLADQSAAAEAQRHKAEETARAEARAKAERAAKAGKSVTGAPGTSPAALAAARADSGSLRDQLESAWDSIQAA